MSVSDKKHNVELAIKLRQVFNYVVNNDGCVFGEALVDLFCNCLSGIYRSSIMIHKSKFTSLNLFLQSLGYKCQTVDKNTHAFHVFHVFRSEIATVEVFVEKEDYEGKRLYPYLLPDYDVNLLAYDKNGFYEWSKEFEVDDIIYRIINKQAIILQPDINKKKEFAKRGFTIVA
jgi:hypothetical protein